MTVANLGPDQSVEPSVDELTQAWTTAIQCRAIIGAGAEARRKLMELRSKKYTWIGHEENRLRFALDQFIRGES